MVARLQLDRARFFHIGVMEIIIHHQLPIHHSREPSSETV